MNGSVSTDEKYVSVKYGYDIVVLKCVRMYISVSAWTGPEDSRRLRLSDFETVGT